MGLLCKRYDMIALLLQAAPEVYHNLPKAIITLNSPEAIIAGDLLCGRLANACFFYIDQATRKKHFKRCAPVMATALSAATETSAAVASLPP